MLVPTLVEQAIEERRRCARLPRAARETADRPCRRAMPTRSSRTEAAAERVGWRKDRPDPDVGLVGDAVERLAEPMAQDDRLTAPGHATDEAGLAVHLQLAQPLLVVAQDHSQRLALRDLVAEQVGIGFGIAGGLE